MASAQKHCSSLDHCSHNSNFSLGWSPVGSGTCAEGTTPDRVATAFQKHTAGLPPNSNRDRCVVGPLLVLMWPQMQCQCGLSIATNCYCLNISAWSRAFLPCAQLVAGACYLPWFPRVTVPSVCVCRSSSREGSHFCLCMPV